MFRPIQQPLMAQGSGGGPAGADTSEEYSLFKPYDIYGEPNAKMVEEINEMFEILFKQVKSASAAITAASSGGGNVTGPSSSVTGDVPYFADTTGELLADSGKLYTDLVTGPASATSDNIATFDGITGKIIKDSGFAVGAIANGSLAIATLDLTDTQIKASNSSPQTIVPAPASDQTLVPIYLIGSSDSAAGAYAANITFAINYGNNTAASPMDSPINFSFNTATTLVRHAGATAYGPGTGVKAIGQKLMMRASADTTGGNAANFLKWRLVYGVVTF